MTLYPTKWLYAISISCLMLAPLSAQAEKADRNQPMNIEADTVRVDDAKKISIFEGKVLFTQGTLQVKAARVEVNQQGKNQLIAATGSPVAFKQKRDGRADFIEAYAKRVDYDSKAQTIKLSGDALLRMGGDEVRGQVVTYDAKTEVYQVLGAAGNASTGTKGGRVKIILQPRNLDNGEDTPTAPSPAQPEAKKP